MKETVFTNVDGGKLWPNGCR